jgi:tRNA-specific 2-thiouridylase
MSIRFDQPLRDITPGQGAVVYNGDVVLGGGVIERPLTS